ncbi:hypothetical protein [Pseudoalteromonas sp. HM-SA03]|uniref:hypothetical protein n=1 Tax=Pseudoalteromonas sp. HM-SA03 TaxID=2029678 RepID=UPI0020D15B39|nr:hypothetical protein [Pseudoalteromonas sp. HM-SA03]
MNSVSIIAIGLTAMLASLPSIASSTNFMELGFGRVAFDSVSEIEPKGFVITANIEFGGLYLEGASALMADDVAVTGLVYGAEEDVLTTLDFDVDSRIYTLLVGKQFDLNDHSLIDIYGGYSRHRLEIAYSGLVNTTYYDGYTNKELILFLDQGKNESSDHYHLEAAYDYTHVDLNFRVGVGFERIQDDESENNLVYLAEVGYRFTNNISANVSYRNAEIYNTLSLNLRYSF